MNDGKSGPKKLSAELKLIPGMHNTRHRGARLPSLPESDLKAPSHLDRAAKREWKRITAQVHGLGVLCALDLPLLEIWCTTWAQLKRCEAVLAKEGDSFTTASGYVQQRPEVAIRGACIRTLTKLSAQLGFSPAARSRLALPTSPPVPAKSGTDGKPGEMSPEEIARIERKYFGEG